MTRKSLLAGVLTSVLLVVSVAMSGAAQAGPGGAGPSELTVTLTSTSAGAATGATASYTADSYWADTGVTFTFAGWTANSTFSNSGACPSTVVVTATGTVTACTWENQGSNAVLSLNLNAPGVGQTGLVRAVIAEGLLTNPLATGTYTVTMTESSDRGGSLTQSFSFVGADSSAPPSWFQAYGRHSSEETCDDTWHPSWGQWMNSGAGGWVCVREHYYDMSAAAWLYRALADR